MTKKEKIRVLLSQPLKVLRKGFAAIEEDVHSKSCYSEHQRSSLPTVDFLTVLSGSEFSLNSYSFLHGTSLITDLALLKGLASQINNCAYLEIGSWRGESLANVYQSTKDCTAITLSEKEMKTLGFGDEFIKAHAFYTKDKPEIKYLHHNSQTFDFSNLQKRFDLVFIDGDHSYNGVLTDTRNVFKHCLKNENAIVVWHDYGWDTETVRPSVLRAILNGVPKDLHKNLYHVSNTLCAIYSAKPLDIDSGYQKFYPNKNFQIDVSVSKY